MKHKWGTVDFDLSKCYLYNAALEAFLIYLIDSWDLVMKQFL